MVFPLVQSRPTPPAAMGEQLKVLENGGPVLDM